MEAKDLMLGDLIYVYGRNNNMLSKPHWYVRQVNADWLVHMEKRERDDKKLLDNGIIFPYNQPFIGDTKPIPLTEEILNKNGFEVEDCISNITFWLAKNNGDGKICILIEFEYDVEEEYYILTIGNSSITFSYVHELQHALRLCGLNELADNFKTGYE